MGRAEPKILGRTGGVATTHPCSDPPASSPASSGPLDAIAPTGGKPYGRGDLLGGQYRLESLLGRGGMGEVWTAKNETLGVLRAVKLIRADVGSPENTDRLLREARAAARLADPAIVRVFDFGRTDSGDPYIVMELLEGEDLIGIIDRRERLSPVKVVQLLLPVIRALGTAHASGIVHRDLKPENIFLARAGEGRVQPKLLDFGIAKLESACSLRLTTAGEVMGSPLYMAPEQARGEEVDERVDVWSICVVLYEAISGETPFLGEDRGEVFRTINLKDPESLVDQGLTDDALWRIVRQGLAKDRDERFASMRELGTALAQWLHERGVRDDIAGASIETGWLMTNRPSFFSSSLPPHRSGLQSAGARAAAAARRGARALDAGARCALSWIATRGRRHPVVAATLGALAVVAGIGIGLSVDSEPRLVRRAAEPHTQTRVEAATARKPAPAKPTSPTDDPDPAPEESAAAATEANDGESSDESAEPNSPAERAKAQRDRRARLIDPYR